MIKKIFVLQDDLLSASNDSLNDKTSTGKVSVLITFSYKQNNKIFWSVHGMGKISLQTFKSCPLKWFRVCPWCWPVTCSWLSEWTAFVFSICLGAGKFVYISRLDEVLANATDMPNPCLSAGHQQQFKAWSLWWNHLALMTFLCDSVTSRNREGSWVGSLKSPQSPVERRHHHRYLLCISLLLLLTELLKW